MTKLSNLIQFSKPLTQLLTSLPSGSWNRSPPANPVPGTQLPPLNLDSSDSRAVLARWTMDVIETLVSVLETKARVLLRPKSGMAASLFVLNNLSEVEKRVRGDKMMMGIVAAVAAEERGREREGKRGSRVSSGSGVNQVGSFSMPKSFEKAKRAGLDGKPQIPTLFCKFVFVGDADW